MMLIVQAAAVLSLGTLPALPAPQIFAPGIVSSSGSNSAPTFSPDGNTLFFARTSTWGVILESDRVEGKWSQPRIAPFSGAWNDWSPEFSPDGRYVVFTSVRNHVANIWRSTRVGNGWGDPVRLPDTVNIGPSIWKASIVGDGSIYFTKVDKGGKRLYCSRYVSGAYQMAQPLSFSDGKHGDVDPAVARDESFMVFASNGRIADDTRDHLFIAFNKSGTWSDPVQLHYSGDDAGGGSTDNEPRFSPDGHTLYFTSDRVTPAHFPRTQAQAELDLQQLETWNNGNGNAWSVPLTIPTTM